VTDAELTEAICGSVAPKLKVPPEEVHVHLLRSAALPEHVVFNATKKRGSDVNGLVLPGGEVVAGARQALEVVLSAWGAEPSPSPRERAEVVSWLLASERQVQVIDAENRPRTEPGPVVAAMVGPPEVDGGVLRFWWESRTGLARVEVSIGRKGVDHEIVQAFEIEDGTYDPAGFDAAL
jgi:hypothetical protein